MENKQNRRRFLSHCVQYGGACCALLACNRRLPAQENAEKKPEQKKKPIDLKQLSYCCIPCMQVCELYKATLENDVKMKKLVYDKWNWKKKFGMEFDPEKVFCHTCKPGDKPQKAGMDTCEIRICAMASGVEACLQCKNLAACSKEFWKTWPESYEFAKKLQARYITQPGASLIEPKTK